MLRSLLLSTTLLALLAPTQHASAQTKPEDAIQYRQAAYKVLLWNWMPMNSMMRGRIEFDSAEFARRAGRVAAIAPQLLEGFPEGSHSGARTAAKREIWSRYADFTGKMQDFERESAELARIAAEGDEAATKEQFAKTAGTCKACHDQYKSD